MCSKEDRLDGFTDTQRVVALKEARAKLQADLEIFIQEEKDAFNKVDELDEQLKVCSNPELEERRRQKFVWASGLKWNILYQKKEIKLCEEAIVREESQLLNSSVRDCTNMSRDG